MQKAHSFIGLVNPKSPTNVGMVMRAAGCFEVDAVFYSGTRFERARKFATDTKNAQSKIPLTYAENLPDAPVAGAKLVAIELIEGAVPLMDFVHPENAYYIFGPEDGSLKKEILDACDHVVYIPTIGCMNLAATVHVVLYDRMSKSGREVIAQRPIADNRDVNNNITISR
ncbi:TrmH family RNA methyltransferase [Cellvibrio sp. KY-GH-1]|uniref:RNA methyltransferase n=1 Tax=Cellvibrio sp. KY-GH-1 TaxID=2303332 RepID=UPI0012491299|nr:RNA methyltransferase [Cellvibrio sp. KY-GH-1]QEY14826.1 TrmH family RNA methyltransferase [Cellvibrio sp. KY-GH-1]